MITVYHNPRCSKSRESITFIEAKDQAYKIIKYLDDAPTKDELKEILTKLKYKPIELVRVKESLWQENFSHLTLTDEEVIDAMLAHPILIERPIVINGSRAVVARPTEKINEIL